MKYKNEVEERVNKSLKEKDEDEIMAQKTQAGHPKIIQGNFGSPDSSRSYYGRVGIEDCEVIKGFHREY
jgi:hypothetical protein